MEQRGDKKEWLEKQCHWNNLCKQTQDLLRKKKIYHHLTFLSISMCIVSFNLQNNTLLPEADKGMS